MGKEGAFNLVSLLSKSLEPVVEMHNNDRVICSCGHIFRTFPGFLVLVWFIKRDRTATIASILIEF